MGSSLFCSHVVSQLQLSEHWPALAGRTLLLSVGSTATTVSNACHLLVGHILQSHRQAGTTARHDLATCMKQACQLEPITGCMGRNDASGGQRNQPMHASHHARDGVAQHIAVATWLSILTSLSCSARHWQLLVRIAMQPAHTSQG